jgi:energy-coupling factor transporter ATP-binding protein EcfA2
VITRLEIENFKAIKKLAIDLDPLTVLVGPNDAGKSTILQALDLLSRSLERPVYRPGEPSVFDGDPTESIHHGDRTKAIRVAVVWPDGSYELSLGWRGGAFVALREVCAGHGLYFSQASGTPAPIELPNRPASPWEGHRSLLHLHLEAMPHELARLRTELSSFLVALEPRKLAVPCGPDVEFASSGLGLVALTDRILTDTDRTARDAYEESLRSFSPHVAGVGTRPVTVSRANAPTVLKELVFGLRDRTRVPAREASAGLLAIAGYLALLHLPARRFLVEEPENGVHPRALLSIADVLRDLAAHGRQVVMTTHSPVLLNYIDAEHIRIVTRAPDEGVRVTAALESRVFNELRQRVDFGELWYSIGDEPLAAQ